MGKRNRGRGRGNTNRRPNVATKQQATSVQQNNSIQQSPFTANQAFNPGIPLLPTPLFGPTPRLFPYTPGINIYQQPRIGERTSFDELRDLAVSYDAIQLCEQAWYDVWRGLEPRVVPGPHLLKEGQSEDDYLDDILKYEAMFEKPDGVTDILDLCQAALRDRLEIDAVAWYIHKTNDGDFYALELVDGATIKPLVDARGQRPSPPWPAYEQYLYGAPAGEYTADEMIYMRETHRSNSLYGFSRVENFIMRVNMAIRKQARDMARFTYGNMPAGFIEVPGDIVGWTPSDLEAYRQMWNAMYAGNDAQRAQARVGLPGTKFTKFDEDPILTDFDQFLLNMACGSFGTTMADLSFTDDVNRSTGESQRGVMFRRTVRPTAKTFSRLFTHILKNVIGDPRFIFEFCGYEEAQDFNALSAAHVSLVTSGIESPSDAAKALQLPTQVEVPAFVMTQSGPFVIANLANKEVQLAQMHNLLAPPQPAKPAKPEEGNAPDSTPDTEETSEGQSDDTAGAEQGQSESAQSGDESGDEGQGDTQERVARAERVAATYAETGMMIAFMLKPEVAEQLALPDGLPVSEMHCTLAYLGSTDEPIGTRNPAESPEMIVQILDLFAKRMHPLEGQTGGFGRFAASESSDGLSPVIALVNCPGLQDWRRELVSVLEQAGYGVANDFDYQPHITLAYIPEDAPMPIDNVPALPLVFDVLTLAIGNQHYDFPIGLQQERVARSADAAFASREELAQRIADLFEQVARRGEQKLREDDSA